MLGILTEKNGTIREVDVPRVQPHIVTREAPTLLPHYDPNADGPKPFPVKHWTLEMVLMGKAYYNEA